jgi:hypothetical protein
VHDHRWLRDDVNEVGNGNPDGDADGDADINADGRRAR